MKGMKKLGLAVVAVGVLAFLVPQAMAVLSKKTATMGAQRLVVVNSTDAYGFGPNQNSFVPLTDASTTIFVPSGQTARLVARFSARSTCTGGPTNGFGNCAVRILTDGVEMSPASGIVSIFDSVGESNDWEESHSIDRTSNVLSSGTHTVTVEVRTSGEGTAFNLATFQLTVEEWRVS